MSESKKHSRRKPLGSYCCMDPDVVATFICARCRKPFCEQCVGQEDGRDTFCLQCAVIAPKSAPARDGKSRSGMSGKGKIVLAFIAGAILATNIYVIVSGMGSTAQVRRTPPMSAELADLVECRHRLEHIATLVDEYQETVGVMPGDIHDLMAVTRDTKVFYDPASKLPYRLETGPGNDFTVVCPSPERHGLAGLFATHGRPAQMVFTR